MSTAKERQTKELRSICGHVEKQLIEDLKAILGARGWQEKVLNQSLQLSLSFLRTASKYETVDFLFSENLCDLFKIVALPEDERNDKTS